LDGPARAVKDHDTPLENTRAAAQLPRFGERLTQARKCRIHSRRDWLRQVKAALPHVIAWGHRALLHERGWTINRAGRALNPEVDPGRRKLIRAGLIRVLPASVWMFGAGDLISGRNSGSDQGFEEGDGPGTPQRISTSARA
jgi:hypothetical protein